MTGWSSPPARDRAHATAYRLLARRIPERSTSVEDVAARVDFVFAHLYRSLSQWVGTAGCQALFTRAIMLSAQQHPVLRGVRYQPSAEPHFDRFADNGGVHGGDAIAEAVTSVLASIITMLNGLIGEDIATNLLEEALPSEPAGATPSESAIEQDPHTVPRRGRPTETQSDD